MTKSRRELKFKAKLAMKGNFGILVLAMFLTMLLNMASTSITNLFFSGSGTFTFILSEIFSFIISLVLNVFIAGYAYMNLKVARGEAASVSDLLYFFKNGSDRAIIAGSVLSLLQLAASIPVLIFHFTAVPGDTPESVLLWQSQLLALMLLALVLQMIFSIPFSMSYYLLVDDPDMGGAEAIRESVKMMKHHMGAYLIMEISFFPMILGSIITFYLALIWVLPYMNMVEAEFYRDLAGEFETDQYWIP